MRDDSLSPQHAHPKPVYSPLTEPLNASALDRQKLEQCIHCGMCLEVCPSYAVFETELDSPRGRIALMRAASDGRISLSPPDPSFITHIDRCLGCRACETACPSGVQYGALLEQTQAILQPERKPVAAERALRWLGLQQLMPHTSRLKMLGRLMWLYQYLGLPKIADFVAPALPAPLRAMQRILPDIKPRYQAYSKPLPAIGQQRGRVAFLHGCIQEAFLASVNVASVRVLRRNGFEVHFPQAQTCCGAAHIHSGDLETSKALARQNIDACLASNVDVIISNAGGCGLALKEYADLLHDDPVYAQRAATFVSKLRDISEFLVEQGDLVPGSLEARVTYVESCHLRHGQRIVQQPRQILRAIQGLDFVELAQPDRCCGSAGIYNITQPDSAEIILRNKINDIIATGAEIVAVSNTGCHMQILAGVRDAGLKVEVLHIVEILDRAMDVRSVRGHVPPR